MDNPPKNKQIVALDVGEQRIGVALASVRARLPLPFKTLHNGSDIWAQLTSLLDEEEIVKIIIGLPRNMHSQDTAQTKQVREFAKQLRIHTDLPVVFQDEAVTSVKAKQELDSRARPYTKADIDALAATYILEDYFAEERQGAI